MGIALFILAAMILAVLPIWPHSRNWGFFPSGGVASVFVAVLAAMMLGFW